MLNLYAPTFKEGWTHFAGGEWATIVTPEDGGTAYPVRPDGSLCEPRPLRPRERKELAARQIHHADLKLIAAAMDADQHKDRTERRRP